jgi:hypothetical protein
MLGAGTASDSLVNDTVTGTPSNGVAAVFSNGPTTRLTNVTVANNAAGGALVGGGTLTLTNSLLASNSRNCGGSITDGGHNLSFPASDTSCPATFAHGDPKLAASLHDNGGPTQTLALQAGSAAIDQIPATGAHCPSTDQRGVHRPQGTKCDTGAFEFAKPTITIRSPINGAHYVKGERVLALYGCKEAGGTTLITSCFAPVKPGAPINTSSLGSKTFTVTATDKAGVRSTKTVSYTVVPQPMLNNLSQTHERWAEHQKAGTAPGTTFTFTVNVPGTITITFIRNRKVAGRLTATTEKGSNAVTFTGQLPNGTLLPAGTYTAVFTAADDFGTKSAPKSLSFTILPS